MRLASFLLGAALAEIGEREMNEFIADNQIGSVAFEKIEVWDGWVVETLSRNVLLEFGSGELWKLMLILARAKEVVLKTRRVEEVWVANVVNFMGE
tara:strand:+ start:278 stop:565 length:288 start_codon:yes stop_codon:yes gene_type:complete